MSILLKNIKVGDKFKIVGNRLSSMGYHEFCQGAIVQISYKGSNTFNIGQVPGCKSFTGRYVAGNVNDLAPLALNKKELEQELEELDKAKQEIQSKIDWIDETGSEEYDEVEVKVWTTLKTLENKKLTPLEKSKAIANLIKNG